MNEARYSFNVRFNLNGYDSQFTLRSDDEWLATIQMGYQAVRQLAAMGAKPDRRWESVKGNGNSPEPNKGTKNQVAVCPECGQVDQVELITWNNARGRGQAWKCQRCGKWMPKNFVPPKALV